MNLFIQRDILSPTFSSGLLLIEEEFQCYTLEDAVRPPGVKVPGKTAIPAGRYKLVLDESIRFGRMMPHILNVSGFEGIRIHAGNTAEDTEGCILVGTERHDGGRVLGYSRKAFDALFGKLLFCEDECWIEIKNQAGGVIARDHEEGAI